MKMKSISIAIITQFGLLYTIGSIEKFNLCFDNNFYHIGAHIICTQYANIVFFIISVVIAMVNGLFLIKHKILTQSKDDQDDKRFLFLW